MAEVTIVTTRETFRIDDAGNTQKVRVVLWRYGKDGPFTLELPEAEFTAERVKRELDRLAGELRALQPPEAR